MKLTIGTFFLKLYKDNRVNPIVINSAVSKKWEYVQTDEKLNTSSSLFEFLFVSVKCGCSVLMIAKLDRE